MSGRRCSATRYRGKLFLALGGTSPSGLSPPPQAYQTPFRHDFARITIVSRKFIWDSLPDSCIDD